MKFIMGLLSMVLLTLGCSSAFADSGGSGGTAFTQEYVYDFAKHGGAVGAIVLTNPKNVLPLGSYVTSVHYHVITAMTSGGSATVAIGDAAGAAKYLAATAYNDAAYALNNIAAAAIGVPNLILTTEGTFQITIATAALTAGKIRFVVSGYVPKALPQ